MICLKIFLSLILLFGAICFRFLLKFCEYDDYMMCYGCREMDTIHTEYDYIVVGLGTAGSIVARRLAEDGHTKVLALEAGAHGMGLMHIPAFSLLLQKSAYDWQHRTVTQRFACKAFRANGSSWPMGKIVGGTHMLNNMIYTRGHPEDYKNWYEPLNSFTYEQDVLPYFKKLENYVDNNTSDTSRGSALISDPPFLSSITNKILAAAKSLGFPVVKDHITATRGFSKPKVTMFKGERWTTANQLLSTKRTNLVVRSQVTVEQVLFTDNYEANAVKYLYLNDYYYASAKKGVILSAGVIGSPKILMLSGIGIEQQLVPLGITPIVNLPVGENLQDHITTGLDLIRIERFIVNTRLVDMLHPYSIYRYFMMGSGPWATAGCDVLGFLNEADLSNSSSNVSSTENEEISSNALSSARSENSVPELQLMVIPLGVSTDNGVVLRDLVDMKRDIWKKYFKHFTNRTVLSIMPVLLHPKSRGTVKLRNANINTPVAINPKYLQDPYDLKILMQGIKMIKKLIDTEPMRKAGAKLNKEKLPGCEGFQFDTDEYWECYIRHLTLTTYHPVGTCKMGEGPTSVVDFDFKVRGINNLYVIDGSVMPTLTSGNPNAAIMMLAEKGADAIKYQDYLQSGRCYIDEIFLPKTTCTFQVPSRYSYNLQKSKPLIVV